MSPVTSRDSRDKPPSFGSAGLAQIDQAIAQVTLQLGVRRLPLLDRWFLQGQRRELLAARWVVMQLVSIQSRGSGALELRAPSSGDRLSRRDGALDWEPSQVWEPNQVVESGGLVSVAPSRVSAVSQSGNESSSLGRDVAPEVGLDLAPDWGTAGDGTRGIGRSRSGSGMAASPALNRAERVRAQELALWDDLSRRLQGDLHNLTDLPLELDILRLDRKRELFYLILRQLEATLDDLRRWALMAQGDATERLEQKRSQIGLDLWQQVVEDFFGKYTSVNRNGQRVELVPIILAERDLVQREILDRVPFVGDALAYWVLQQPLTIEDLQFRVGSPEATERLALIVQNWCVQLANAVMQPLLNRFGDVVEVKQTFYDRRLLSSREIERFRNNLSWKYRVERYWREPQEIFESRHVLFALEEDGITQRSIYAPRNLELDQLRGTRLAVTLLLEARDAVAPRLKTATSLLGSGVVYLLTEVVGKGLGLIGKGLLKGLGNAWQESRKR
jgi:hypothetical protein